MPVTLVNKPQMISALTELIVWVSGSQSVVPRQAASAPPENLLEMQILGPTPEY